MARVYSLMSTGIPELDHTLQGIRPGDNIVWQVDSIDDYLLFVRPFCKKAVEQGNKLVYFRFADHAELVPRELNIEIHHLNPEKGFESFITEIFKVIEKNGYGVFYVFDCLSELTVDWYSDQMLANFFMLTCPYLYDFDTATYFALLRNYHTNQAINAIHNTAQVIIDVFHNMNNIYIQPIKVYKRYSSTMYMLHHWQDGNFNVVKNSTIISEILKKIPHPWLDFSISRQDMWTRIFNRAREIEHEMEKKQEKPEDYESYRHRLLRMMVTRDERLLKLAERYFDLSDLIDIGRHMIGTGLIGGKAMGMLLARAILKKQDERWKQILEPQDSFFIGSDVFYTYLIKSGCWWTRWKQRSQEDILDKAEEAKKLLLTGNFPDDIQNQFNEILNYFGQFPLIIRSSSLLEDAYGNSFSGKYESIFLANQGTPRERLDAFINAIRTVYASTMNQEALLYRAKRGLLQQDEQMALLVQRVSGSAYGHYFYPQVSGVGISFNPYVWNKDIDPQSGVLRIVFGLGTRAVNRYDDDYTRIVALNQPLKRPESNYDELIKYTQHQVDLLDLKNNMQTTYDFSDIAKENSKLLLDFFAKKDRIEGRREDDPDLPWRLSFDPLLSDKELINNMTDMLKILQHAYQYPVDVEFTINFIGNDYKINLVQCRPFQFQQESQIITSPGKIKQENIILKTRGPIIGKSIHAVLDWIIYVTPSVYSKLSVQDRYSVARLIGRIIHLDKKLGDKIVMIIGPGRWATTSPSLGVPVNFSEINSVSVICEIAEMHEGLVPDVSLGTHFFNDLVEMDMQYMACYPKKNDTIINETFLKETANKLKSLLPESAKWSEVVKVIDGGELGKKNAIYIYVNSMEQEGICYLDKKQ